LLRAIDRFVDLSDVRSHLAPFYSSTGRPSIDPELLVRMLLVGYCYGIRSERRLCEEVHLNLAYRWFCRLGLDGEVPDHSTFSKNRHGRFRDCDLLRKLFETVVRRCMAEGLVEGAAFAVDASLIAADANKQRSAAGSDDVDWEVIARTRRSVREYLDTLDEAAWGAASETVPKFISKSDPAAQWTGAHKGHAFFAYADNCSRRVPPCCHGPEPPQARKADPDSHAAARLSALEPARPSRPNSYFADFFNNICHQRTCVSSPVNCKRRPVPLGAIA
jgi:transposase